MSAVAITEVIGSRLYFNAYTNAHGTELWKSDGSIASTVMISDIFQGTSSSNPKYLTDVNGTLYFAAQDSEHGLELWKTRGTALTTKLVKDIRPGISSGLLSDHNEEFVNVNGMLFFTASTGHGVELWKSNGTPAGTIMVKNINPGSASSYPRHLTNVNGVLFFTATNSTNT